MGISRDYRAAAASARAAASQEPLPNRRELHERSAMLWEEMAERAEKFGQRAAEREAAKIERREAVQG